MRALNNTQGNNTKSHEYLDSENVLRAKMENVAKMILRSRNCVAYCGAGLSKAAGISDYATKSDKSGTKETVNVTCRSM